MRDKEIGLFGMSDGVFSDVQNTPLPVMCSKAIENYSYLFSWYLGNWVFTQGSQFS